MPQRQDCDSTRRRILEQALDCKATHHVEDKTFAEQSLSRDNHYVPQSYLRRFSPQPRGKFVYAYSLLVPHEGLEHWEHSPTKSIAVRRDLYTSVSAGKESDDIETWLADEVETPAQAVLDKLTSRTPLTQPDRRKLARYIASLDARSPLYYVHHTQVMAECLPAVLDAQVRSTLEAVERGDDLPEVPEHAFADYPVLSVKLNRGDPGADNAFLDLNVVLGRETWLHSIRHVVDEVSKFLEPHDWRVIRPHDGWTWYTSDNPVVRLVAGPETYHLQGKYGDRGTEIMLPLSPTCLLYAQVAAPARHEQFSLRQTYFVKRFIAENAYRWIVAANPVQHATWFRARRVNLDEYNKERGEWAEFHTKQAGAIHDLRRKDSSALHRAS